jgi:hypothetical protein
MRDGYSRIDGVLSNLPPRDLARVATEAQRRWVEAQLDGVGYDGEDEARTIGRRASALGATDHQLYRSLYEQGAGVRSRATVLAPLLVQTGLAFHFSTSAAEGWRAARGAHELLGGLTSILPALAKLAAALQPEGASGDADVTEALAAFAALPGALAKLADAINERASSSEDELRQFTETSQDVAALGRALLAEAREVTDRLGVDALPAQYRLMLAAGERALSGEVDR